MATRRGNKQPAAVAKQPSEQPAAPRLYLPAKDPWMPAEYGDAEVQAVKALCDGRADANQQRIAIKWILESAANVNDIDFRPGGLEGERATCFNSGRRFVGSQILKLKNLNLAAIRRS